MTAQTSPEPSHDQEAKGEAEQVTAASHGDSGTQLQDQTAYLPRRYIISVRPIGLDRLLITDH